jgi:hypothetical protein
MQPQSYTPSGGLGSSPGGGSPILLILVIILGLGTVGFGTLTVMFSGKASTATQTLESEKAKAAKAAAEAQKKLDDEAYTKQSESPYRSYTAPEAFGSFVINFPKNWSSLIDETPTGTQVNLIINPEFIRRAAGQSKPVAVRIHLEDRSKDSYIQQYSGQVKSGTLKRTDTKVSEQPAWDYTGTFSDKKTVREVVVPIRDKVLVFTTEDAQYASEFAQILEQAKIIP